MNSTSTESDQPAWGEQRQLMAAIVESSPDAILSKTPDGIITSWNQGAERLYGFSAAEAVGQHVRLIMPNGLTDEEPAIRQALKQGWRLDQFETQRQKKSGEIVEVSITLSPLRDAAGQLLGSAGISRDITRRKRIQEALQQAIIDAEQANKARSEFMANISHELRTPMNAILGMTELSLNEPLPDIVRDYLETVKESADTMLALINDILDFSRLEADGFELDPVPFDIRRMLDETMKTLSLRAHEKGLELVAKIHADVPLRIVADKMRIRQMLTNLVGNAIKFTESGEVVVTVDPVDDDASDRSEWAVADPVTLHFCVADTGIGISPADQQRIFAPFTQADASMTRLYTGTGLGLSICNELAKLQGGRIWLKSNVGHGSRFHFTINAEVAPATQDIPNSDSTSIEELAGTRVLVVDDNETTRHILKEMLESWSMVPSTADSAESAIAELAAAARQGDGFPLLLVDAVMPSTDGIELLERIEQSTESVGASILMMSSADKHLFRRRSDGLPVGAFVEKPVSQSSLLNAIREAVGDVAAVRSPNQTIVPGTHRLNVLVAEDIPANQKVVSAILNKRGHDVAIAHNGRDAIDMCQRGDFDIILMDVQMPVLDGLQATKAIRQVEAGSEERIPIVAMTAHAMRGDREACLAAGMDSYISKPLDSDLLLRTLEGLAKNSESSAGSFLSLFTKSGMWRFRTSDAITNAEPKHAAADAGAQPESTIWDLNIALKRMGGDTTILLSMVNYFFEDSPDLLEQLTKHLQAEDTLEAHRMAHSLKGLCANFEAESAVDCAQKMETACREANLSEANALLTTLNSEVRRLSEALALWTHDQT